VTSKVASRLVFLVFSNVFEPSGLEVGSKWLRSGLEARFDGTGFEVASRPDLTAGAVFSSGPSDLQSSFGAGFLGVFELFRARWIRSGLDLASKWPRSWF
jgi:hypothetical protein